MEIMNREAVRMATCEDLSKQGFVLNGGSGQIPALGFGTLIADRDETRSATKAAVEVGFRHFDCAERYRNEEQVGAALNVLGPLPTDSETVIAEVPLQRVSGQWAVPKLTDLAVRSEPPQACA